MLRFRTLEREDQARLWDWLHIALWDPPPAPLRPRELLQSPHVRIYAETWGQPGDVGVVAHIEGNGIGACWIRALPQGVGMASIDARTPQLGIALEAPYRHRGFGKELLLAGLQAASAAGYKNVSLTVHPLNPAIRMYEGCGFVKREIRNSYHLMVAHVA